jgi:ABC-type bacteriocin/lantibiotic exporter with double-glycine peptidase domain
MKSSTSSAAPTLKLIQELNNFSPDTSPSLPLNLKHEYFSGKLSVSNLDFSYTDSERRTIQNLSFEIEAGEFVAIVGPSGAGKTTLADLILGVIEPDSGEVVISGLPSSVAIKKWPGAIAYVPQDVLIVRGSVLENVSLGYPITGESERLALQALEIAELHEFVRQLPNGLRSEMGERGAKISGGQRQRLGLARALFTNPRLLVLDEATSSLDGETEAKIAHQISSLRGQTTLIVIAHRLSTVRNADKVIYLNHGRIESIGTFNQVRDAIPDFDNQAALMGLEKGE